MLVHYSVGQIRKDKMDLVSVRGRRKGIGDPKAQYIGAAGGIQLMLGFTVKKVGMMSSYGWSILHFRSWRDTPPNMIQDLGIFLTTNTHYEGIF